MIGRVVIGVAVLLGSAAFAAPERAAMAKAPGAAAPVELAFLDRLRGRRGGGECLDVGAVRDADVRRNAAAIGAARLCVTGEAFAEGGIDWRFTIVDSGRQGPVWYMPHDNESAAFDAAIYSVARYGGKLVAVDGAETRNHGGVDPNRHFAPRAADASACRMRRAAPQYTRYVMGHFRGARHVLSIHNNTRGGGVSVNMKSAKTTGFRAAGRFSDPDHLVFIAGTQPISRDRAAQAARDKLLRAGLNVVHEHVTHANNDCSFSNHIALNDRRAYYNVEAVHGSRLQKGMVDALLGTLGYRPR